MKFPTIFPAIKQEELKDKVIIEVNKSQKKLQTNYPISAKKKKLNPTSSTRAKSKILPSFLHFLSNQTESNHKTIGKKKDRNKQGKFRDFVGIPEQSY